MRWAWKTRMSYNLNKAKVVDHPLSFLEQAVEKNAQSVVLETRILLLVYNTIGVFRL
jgi:hypothetical protein